MAGDDVGDIRERLGRIEAGLAGQHELLDRMVSLFDRVLSIELIGKARDERMARVEGKLDGAESELRYWRTTRTVGTWAIGIFSAAALAVFANWLRT